MELKCVGDVNVDIPASSSSPNAALTEAKNANSCFENDSIKGNK